MSVIVYYNKIKKPVLLGKITKKRKQKTVLGGWDFVPKRT